MRVRTAAGRPQSRLASATPPTTAAAALLLLVHLAWTLPASAGSGGSVYSRFGIGDLRISSSAALLGLGGTGVALAAPGAVNDLNPAAWSGVSRIRFSASALYEGFSTDDGSASAYLAGTVFNGFGLLVPVDSGLGLVFGAGVTPYSRINYRVTGPVSTGALEYTLTRNGDGGVSRAFGGLSARIAPGLSAGAELVYYFGSLRHVIIQSFGGTAYAGTELTRTENLKGTGAAFGLLYDGLGGLLGFDGGTAVSAGLTLATAAWPTVRSERVYRYGAGVPTNPPDTVDGGERSVRIPFALSGGLGVRSGRITAVADLRFQEWQGQTFETSGTVRLRNALRASAGVELAAAQAPGAPTSRAARYSFGLFHDAGYLEAAGERIAESGVTAGFSFPILGDTRLSLAAGFSMRGSTGGVLQEDRIFRISASMDIAELWFQRPEEE